MAFYFRLDEAPWEIITANTLDEAATRYAGWSITFEELLAKVQADGGELVVLEDDPTFRVEEN
jgi:hypothetical protein